jgi:hypothetical protein
MLLGANKDTEGGCVKRRRKDDSQDGLEISHPHVKNKMSYLPTRILLLFPEMLKYDYIFSKYKVYLIRLVCSMLVC